MMKTKLNSSNKTKRIIEVSPEFEAAERAAKHFGFVKLPEIEVMQEDIKAAKRFAESHLSIVRPWSEESERFGGFLEEKIAIMRNFVEKKWTDLGMPLLGYYEGPIRGNPHLKRASDSRTMNLEIIGMTKPVAEAIILETTYVMLKDRYSGEDLTIELNSIGDKESQVRFSRELGSYCRKESGSLPSELRALIKKNVFGIFSIKDDRAEEFIENAPKPMGFLSDTSRIHFKEVLEYLESLNIPYEINHKLLGSRSYCSDTIFEIRGKDRILAIGERYNSLGKKVWGKKDVSALGVAILLHPHFITKTEKRVAPKETCTKFYFIQFGNDAKRKSLTIIESMRQANIAVHQSLSKDKLSAQLAVAEKMNVPYIIMMGQKEAIEESVVVRNMQTRAQETIHLSLLVTHLRSLK